MEHASSYRHILKYTGFFGLVQLATILLAVLRGKVVAVLLGAVGVGLIEVFNRGNELVGALTNLGIPVSGIRHIASVSAERHSTRRLQHAVLLVRSWGAIAALIGVLTALCAAPLLSLVFGESRVSVEQLMTLAPLVGLSTLVGVEWAVLKGLQRLRMVALCTLWGAVALLVAAGLCLSVWQLAGIVPMMTLSVFALFVVQVLLNRRYPWRVVWRRRTLRYGWPLVRLGLFFNAGIALTSAAEMAIRTLLLSWGGWEEVGLYTAGFVLLTAYTRMVFASAEADFYPRLSAATTPLALRLVVDRQIEVYVVLMGACLCVLVLALPWLVPLLYTQSFVAAIPMATAAAFYMLCKAAVTPVAYIALARGDSHLFFVLELLANLTQVLAVALGYYAYGLVGAGIGLSVSYACYLGYALMAAYRYYGYCLGQRVVRVLVMEGMLLSICCLLPFVRERDTYYWLLGGAAACVALGVAIAAIRHGLRQSH